MSSATPFVIVVAALSLAAADNSQCSGSGGIYSGQISTSGDSQYAGNAASVLWKLDGSNLLFTIHNDDFSKQCTIKFQASCIPLSPTSLAELARGAESGGASLGVPPQPSPPGPCPDSDEGVPPTDQKMMLLAVQERSDDCTFFECELFLFSESPPMQFAYCFFRADNPKDNRLILQSQGIQLSCNVPSDQVVKVPVKLDLTRGLPRSEVAPPAWFYYSLVGVMGTIIGGGWIALFVAVPVCQTPEEAAEEDAGGGDKDSDDGFNDAQSDARSVGSGGTSVGGSDARHPDRKLRCRACMVAIDDPLQGHCWSCGAFLQNGGLVVVDKRKQAVRVKRSRHPQQHQQHQHPHPHQQQGYVPPGYPAQPGMHAHPGHAMASANPFAQPGGHHPYGRARPPNVAPFGHQPSGYHPGPPHNGSWHGAPMGQARPHQPQDMSYHPGGREQEEAKRE